ncbi:K domain type 1 [Trinorchestia longiramus]|nr:K domain type 1 [Trinorchestia longiramus]
MKLNDPADMSQLSNWAGSDSEADSELEMRLYSELYFDPNPDFVPLVTQSPTSCSLSENNLLNQTETETLETSSTLPSENIINNASTNLEVPEYTADIKAALLITNASPKIVEKDLSRSEIESTSSPNVNDVKNCVTLPPAKREPVSTPIGRYVFSIKDGHCCESNGSSKRNSFKVAAILSSTPINAIHSSARNHLSCTSPMAKQKINGKSEHLKTSRKRIGTSPNDKLKSCKWPKIEDDVILLSSDGVDEEPSSRVANGRCRNNSSVSSFLSELKKKVGVARSPPKLNEKAKKSLRVNRQRTTFVPGDSSDSGESLPNDSLICNFSLEVDGKGKDVSASNTSQNTRINWPTDYSSTRENKERTPSIAHWTSHMASFYDSDISDEYEIDDLHRTMPDDMMEWEMEADDFPDRPFGGRGRSRYFEQKQMRRCKRCRAYDHTLDQCRKLDYCHLCGDTTHYHREKCPSNCCFRCGREYHTFCPHTCPWNRCEVCHNKGHIKQMCPDLWRRYAFTTSGTVPVHPDPPSHRTVRLPSCFSCGRTGHLGPDCSHRVQNYVVMHQEIQSYAPPTRNCLGTTVLTEDLQEQPRQVDELYGETVQRFTAVRANVSLESSQVGFIIGKKGNLINALRRLFACEISIMEDDSDPNSHLMWLKGAKLDEALRCILFLLNRDADLTGVRENMEKLDDLTGTNYYTYLWKRKMKEFRRTMQKINEKKAKKVKAESSKITVYEVDSDSEDSIVCVTDDEHEETHFPEVGRKSNLKRGRDEKEEEDDSHEDSDLERQIKTAIALKKSKTVVDCEDSKYAAFDKLRTGKENFRSTLASLDSQNCHSSNETDSDSYEEYEDDDSTSHDEYEVESSNEDSELVSDISFDELSMASSIEDLDVFNLSISEASRAKLGSQKSKQFKALLQSLPMGRKSLIYTVNEKLAEINAHVNVESCLAKITINCYAYKENKSEITLNSIRNSLEKLGAYILGCKGLGQGKNIKKEIQRRLRVLENSSARVVSSKEREALAVALAKIVSVDLSSMKYIVGLAKELTAEKEIKNADTSVHSRLSFPKKSNNRAKQSVSNNSLHEKRNKLNWKNYRSFQPIHDIEHLEERLTSGFPHHSHFPKRDFISKKKFARSKSLSRNPKLQSRRASRSPGDPRSGKFQSFKVANAKMIFKNEFKVKNGHFGGRDTSKSPNRKRR